MKFVKGIGLFFVYPLTMLAIGFFTGIEVTRYFYPGQIGPAQFSDPSAGSDMDGTGNHAVQTPQVPADNMPHASAQGMGETGEQGGSEDAALHASSVSETLYVGTKYVLEEMDVLRQTVVETTTSLPNKFVGMNREQFLAAMEIYAASPPLKELERGFVGLEVLSFARERVVVRMNYKYVQPSASFYLAAYDNTVRVYLEDRTTVYIDTEIALDSLPYELQQEIIQMLWIENEEALYNFLETYSS